MVTPVDPLRTYGEQYCVIDMENLFVGTTIEDEILLLGQGPADVHRVREACRELGVAISPGRCLQTCSGGQQALICCALLMTLLPQDTPRILLVHVLETLSATNRQRLLDRFAAVMPRTTISTLVNGRPERTHV